MTKKKATLELEKLLTCGNCGIIQQTGQHCNACGWMPEIDIDLQPINIKLEPEPAEDGQG